MTMATLTVSNNEHTTLTGSPQQHREIWEIFREEQKTVEQDRRSTDISLICPDGCTPVHSFVLQAVSPFFDKIISAQGPLMYLQTPRPVLLPDYKLRDIRKLVQLIYTGSVDCKSEKESGVLKGLVSDFKVNIECANDTSSGVLSGGRNEPGFVNDKDILYYPFDAKKTVKENLTLIRSKPVVNLSKTTSYKQSIKLSTSANAPSTTKDPVFSGTVLNKSLATSTSGTVLNKPLPSQTQSQKTNSPPSGAAGGGGNTNSNNSPGPNGSGHKPKSDENKETNTCKNKDWFMRTACQCQQCDKVYPTPAQAQNCITSHTKLRCYFCFKVVKNTEKLFEHFAENHKKAGRENCLLCPLCEQIVPFKSVSCHVISLHLSETSSAGGGRSNHRAGRPKVTQAPTPAKQPRIDDGKKTSTSGSPDANAKPCGLLQKETHKPENGATSPEKDKQHKLTDLNVTFRKRSICGKTRIFVIKKSRNIEP